ncbi:hypothetical protein [Bradyrhizobium sp. dw_411]|uniref:hypothetical protein n=1 Tax=Bradyrhizobium sp. dw_411 TaxID=2720082 RepID=UPI001BCE2392|nr:hypothetical protein [Bradyrhizobium sp. dw_411]
MAAFHFVACWSPHQKYFAPLHQLTSGRRQFARRHAVRRSDRFSPTLRGDSIPRPADKPTSSALDLDRSAEIVGSDAPQAGMGVLGSPACIMLLIYIDIFDCIKNANS